MPWVAAIPAIIGAAGAIGGSMMGAGASKDAAEEQADATRYATDVQQAMLNQTLAYYRPFYDAGVESLPLMKSIATNIGSSPIYNWRLKEGERTLNNYLAAKGLLGSGAGIRKDVDLTSRLTAEEGDKQFGRLTTLANMGSGAAGGSASATQQTAGNLTNLYMNQGNNAMAAGRDTASLYSNAGGLVAGMATGYSKNQALQDYLKSLGTTAGAPGANSMFYDPNNYGTWS